VKIVILGAGQQGRIAARDLVRGGFQVTVLDQDPRNLKLAQQTAGAAARRFDVRDEHRLVAYLKDFDAVLGALPAALGFYGMRCAVKAGVDMVDMSYLPENPFRLDRQARAKRIRIIPDAGYAPGLSNILCAEGRRALKKIDHLRILVGGIPQRPKPPFNYRITWSPADLLAEYTRPARIWQNFRTVVRPALDGIEEFKVRGIGRLECFYTDGLRTLLTTFRDVRDMEEKTIRYPGHARFFKTLIDAGFLSRAPVDVAGRAVAPYDLTLSYLTSVLGRGDIRDLSILIIELRNRRQSRRYVCIDRYDAKDQITSMARMTAFSAAVIVRVLKRYPGYGVIPPEYLGKEERLCSFIKSEMRKRGIVIKVSNRWSRTYT